MPSHLHRTVCFLLSLVNSEDKRSQTMEPSFADLECRLKGSGQEHLLQYWDELSAGERHTLGQQIRSVADFSSLGNALRESVAALDGASAVSQSIEPPPPCSVFDPMADLDREQRYRSSGLGEISAGRAAVVLLAGGSGTRLGVAAAKGRFVCPQLKQQKSLFQMHSERILRIEELVKQQQRTTESQADISLPFLIMTSEENNDETQKFFEEFNFFGLKRTQVFFFIQSSLPCFDEKSGRVLMKSKASLCLSPGGNGGIYQSLAASGLLEVLRSRGVLWVHIVGVDNLLSKIADPVFIGYAAEEKKNVVVKTTPKTGPGERVGVFALMNKKWGVIEYTEIGAERSAERDAAGELVYNCGNIASHVCHLDFLEFAARKMSTDGYYHAARKDIITMNGKVPGVKLEAFIFDMFALCDCEEEDHSDSVSSKKLGIMQVNRLEEFAPIKNADSAPSDSPATATLQLHKLHTAWAARTLAAAPAPPEILSRLQSEKILVELSPLVSYAGEGLESRVPTIVDQTAAAKDGDVIMLLQTGESNGKGVASL